MHPDDADVHDGALAACANGSKAVYDVTFRIRNTRGEWQWIMERGQAMRVDDRGVPHIVMGTISISARKKSLNRIWCVAAMSYRQYSTT